MKRILVGVDGSEPAAAALGWAGRLAARVGAEVVVANVFEPGQSEVSPETFEELEREANDRLAGEWSQPLLATGVAHRSLLLTGAPEVLLDAAVSEDVDLLVVGTRGHGGFTGLHVGSLAHHFAHHTRRPLAIVPAAGAGEAVERIVVGIDGSDGSDAAASWCANLASAAKIDVIAVYIFEPLADWIPKSDPDGWRQAAEEKMQHEWTASLRAAGVTVRTKVVEHAHPVSALRAAVEDEGGGLLVIGTRGLSRVVGLRVGRLPIQLIHHTQLPVVLVPPEIDEEPDEGSDEHRGTP
jgi:nucleotide-binding universal stress UspA family protein